MKKSYKLKGVDCPSCAGKLEEKLAKLDGVDKISVNFMTQKLSLEAADDRFDAVLAAVAAKQKELEPDWELVI